MRMPPIILSKDAERAADLIHNSHIEGVARKLRITLAEVRNRNINCRRVHLPSQTALTWFGSEKWLYRFAKAVNQRAGMSLSRTTAEPYEVDWLNSTDKPPAWTNKPGVFALHKAQAALWDNIIRIESRWVRLRRDGRVPDHRAVADAQGRDEFQYIVMMSIPSVTELTPQFFGMNEIQSLILTYRLYSNNGFLNRNRYRGHYALRYEKKKSITRVCSSQKYQLKMSERLRALGVAVDPLVTARASLREANGLQ